MSLPARLRQRLQVALGDTALGDTVYRALSALDPGDVDQDVSSGATPTFGTTIFGAVSSFRAEASGQSGAVILAEATANGTHKVTMAAPASLAANRTITVPDADVDLANAALGVANAATAQAAAVLAQADADAIIARYENGAATRIIIADATQNGKLKTTSPGDFRLGGRLYTKSNTDNLWDLSGQSALGASDYKAFWLYLDSSGTASIAAGTVGASSAAAITNLPALAANKSVIGCYVANPNTNFANALNAQGTIIEGWPVSIA